eukprot:255064_1
MQIKKSHVGPLTNYEMLTILNKQMKWHDKTAKKHPNNKIPQTNKLYPSIWIGKEVKSYLIESSASNLTRIDINNLLNEINKIDVNNRLTRLEKLQIVNLLPTSEPLLYSIVNNCDTKFPNEQDIQKLLEIISKYSPDDDESNSDDNEEDSD